MVTHEIQDTDCRPRFDGEIWAENYLRDYQHDYCAMGGERNGEAENKVRWWVLEYDELTNSITEMLKEPKL